MTILNTKKEFEIMRRCGKIAAQLTYDLRSMIRDGVSTGALNDYAYKFIREQGAEPAFLGYNGYPASICVSVNDEIVHGIPGNEKILRDQDLVSVDAGVEYEGFYTDLAFTSFIGKIPAKVKHLMETTKKALILGIKKAKTGNFVGDISSVIQQYVEKNGFGVIRDFVGHGTGRKLHDDPQVPNFGSPGEGIKLEEGVVLAIEPMVSEGDYRVDIDQDGWTARTADRSLSCHFEHTIMVSRSGGIILTR